MYGFSSCCLNDSFKAAQRESDSMSPCSVHSFTDRGVSIGNKNVPDRVRFTRALLESKDLSMWFFFPCAFGAPGSAPAQWKQPLRKDLQDPLFPSTISSSVVPFSSCLQSFPASGSFQMSQFLASVVIVLEFQLQHQSFQ